MAREIDSDEEYQRRQALLEKHEEQDRSRWRSILRSVIPKPDVGDVIEAARHIKEHLDHKD